MDRFLYKKTGPADGLIFAGDELIGEIRGMHLCNLRFVPGHPPIIGWNVPLPLYWRQYAHHEDPDRNAGSFARVEAAEAPAPAEHPAGPALELRCDGMNAQRTIHSLYRVTFHARGSVEISAELEILPGKGWRVTHNPDHGELEFCTVWPERTFVIEPGARKSYSACFIDRRDPSAGTGETARGGRVVLIRHHHLESSDKHNILLGPGDRFGWLLEEENPVVEILSGQTVHAGLCAYMWDAHFAYRCCAAPGAVLLPGGTRYAASFRILSVPRGEAIQILERGVAADPPEPAVIPAYRPGRNTFRETFAETQRVPAAAPHSGGSPAGAGVQYQLASHDDRWPWAFQADDDGVTGELDLTTGHDDNSSLRIQSQREARGIWAATTLGPAFGDPPFAEGRRYAFSAFVRTDALVGRARVGLRLHREGSPGLGEADAYEHYWSAEACSGTTGWTLLEAATPPVSPPPDRVHLLLEQQGAGATWFDDAFFREIG